MWTTITSPVGDLRIVGERRAGQDAAITAIDFLGGFDEQALRQASTVHAAGRAGRPLGERQDGDPLLREAARQLTAYFAGELKEFDLPLAPEGTPFQQRVWEQLRKIGFGERTTYGEIAGRLGMTGHGARAVGLANGRNPVAIVIPCHRVVGATGKLIGYGGGVTRKQTLLDLESGALF